MGEGGTGWPRWLAAGLGGAGAVAAGVGWTVQHRVVRRGSADPKEQESEGYRLPDDVHRQIVETDDGALIHVMERGSGPPLVLAHGIMLTGDVWVHQLRDLAERFRVIVIDQRGHGRSVPGSDGFGLRDDGARKSARIAGVSIGDDRRCLGVRRLAVDLAQVIERLDLHDAVVVGHSTGAMAALQMEIDRQMFVGGPEPGNSRVVGMVLASTTAGPIRSAPGWEHLVRAGNLLVAGASKVSTRVGLDTLPGSDVAWWATRFTLGAEAPGPMVSFAESMVKSVPITTVAGLMRSVMAFDVSDRLELVRLPVLVLGGTHDRVTPIEHARLLSHGIAGSELVEFSRCGHLPMLERRYEFARVVSSFARRCQA